MQIEERLQKMLGERGETLALAESCTGGAIAARLTLLPGASHYFLGGFVVYSNALKESALGVSPTTIDEMGAVSAEVVLELLKGLFQKTTCDWGLTVSGIAGPGGGTAEKPVGTVLLALGKRGEAAEVLELNLSGTRADIIEQVVNKGIEALLERVT